jgi:hypothetical protein
MTVEDAPDRAVGGSHPAHEPELVVGRWTGRARAGVEGQRARPLEFRHRRFGKAGGGGAVALGRAGGDFIENVIEPARVVAVKRRHGRACSGRPASRANSITRAV